MGIGRESNPGRPRAASMKLAGEHSTTEPPMPLTIARLDGLLDCNLKHPGYLTKEDSKAREKKKSPSPAFSRQKTKKKKTLFTWWKNVLPCGESNPGRGGE